MSNCGCGGPAAYAPTAYLAQPNELQPQYQGDVVPGPGCGKHMTPGGILLGTAGLIGLGMALVGAGDTAGRLVFGIAGLGFTAAAVETYRQSDPCQFFSDPTPQAAA